MFNFFIFLLSPIKNLMKKYLLFFVLFKSLACFAQDDSARELLNEGIEQRSQNNFTEAISLFNQSIEAANENGDKKSLADAYDSLGDTYAKLENPEEALKNYLLALPAMKGAHNNLGIAQTSKDLGEVYSGLKRYDLSVKYLNDAIKYAKQVNNEILAADSQSSLGKVYEQQQKIDKALDSYSHALAVYRARGKEQLAGQMLSNMANAYKVQGDYLQSILNYKEALGYFNSANDRHKVADVLSSLGKVHALIEDYNESLRLYEQAYLDAVGIKYNQVIIEASLGMALAYENLRQYPESIRYHKLYEQKKDSFVSQQHAKEMAELRIKYEKNKAMGVLATGEESSNDLAGAHISNQFYIKAAVITVLVLIVIGGTVFFLRRSNYLRRNKEESMFNEAEGQERLRLVQDIHSDLDSKLTEINYLSEAILEKSNGMPTIRSQGEAMQETTKQIEENIRDLVWLLTPRTTTLTNYVSSIQEYVLGHFKDSSVEVLLSKPDGISNNTVSKESQRELLTVIKDSLAGINEDPQATKVFFGITYTGTRLMISIKDNGLGNDKSEADKKKMESHLNTIGGIMRIDSEPGWGTMVKIIIPIHKTAKGGRKR